MSHYTAQLELIQDEFTTNYKKLYTPDVWFFRGEENEENIMSKFIESTELPHYKAEYFVNRETETTLVQEKVDTLLQGSPLDERAVIFMGQRGTGKSWLMRHLKTQLENLPDISSVMIDLQDYPATTPEETVKQILRDISHLIFKETTLSTEELPDLSREFMRHVRVALTEQPLALLIDTVFESDWQLLATLERYLLGPLAAEGQVIVVMAGRGQPYPWKTPELRLRAKFHNLQPFTLEQTKSQLERQKSKSADRYSEIHERSGGNPLASFMLAIQPESPAAGLDQAINELLNVIPDSQNLKELRESLEAISVLNAFDEEQIPTILAAYYQDESYIKWKPSRARRVRENIVRWSFAQWDEKRKGYVLDSTLKGLLQRYLQNKEHQQLWQRLHCAAHQLYTSWVTRYRRTSQRWQTEANFHQHELEKEGFSLEDCSDEHDFSQNS